MCRWARLSRTTTRCRHVPALARQMADPLLGCTIPWLTRSKGRTPACTAQSSSRTRPTPKLTRRPTMLTSALQPHLVQRWRAGLHCTVQCCCILGKQDGRGSLHKVMHNSGLLDAAHCPMTCNALGQGAHASMRKQSLALHYELCSLGTSSHLAPPIGLQGVRAHFPEH